MHRSFSHGPPRRIADSSSPSSEKKFWSCGIPIVLHSIIILYFLWTCLMLGDGAIRSRNPDATISPTSYKGTARAKAFIKQMSGGDAARSNQQQQQQQQQHQQHTDAPAAAAAVVVAPPSSAAGAHPVGNAWADILLLIFPDSAFLQLLHAVPDMAVSVFLGCMTMWSLYIAQTSDPGVIPASWGDDAREVARRKAAAASQQQQQQQAELGGSNNAVVDMSSSSSSSSVAKRADDNGGVSSALSPSSLASPVGAFIDETGSPIVVPPSSASAADAPLPGWTLCTKCQIWRPPRAHHERRTETCVLRLDHYCDFTGNAVAYRTHKCFFLFLFYICSCIYHFWFMLVRFFFAESFLDWLKSSSTMGPTVFLVMYTIIVLITTLWASGFQISVIRNMMVDETTLDNVIVNSGAMRGTGRAPLIRRQMTDSDEDPFAPSPRDAQGRLLPPPSKNFFKRWLYMKPRRWTRNVSAYLGPVYVWFLPQLLPMAPNPLEAYETDRALKKYRAY